MNESPVTALIDAVRRRLWRGHFVAAARVALWATTAILFAAVALHLAVRAVPAAAVGAAVALPWLAALAHAAWRRPPPAAAALWADRHLGGASAYTTLLEAGAGLRAKDGAQGGAQDGALRRLERWAAAQAPVAAALLAARREPLRLWRPLAATLVGAALAGIALTLPVPAAAPAPPAATVDAAPADRPTPLAEAPAASVLVSEVASALRSAAAETQPEPPGAGGAARSEAGGDERADESGPRDATAPDASANAAASAGAAPTAAPTADASPGTGMGQNTGLSAGREAGASRDERADPGATRALGGRIAVQRSALPDRGSPRGRQADPASPAAYDEGLASAAGLALQALPVAAAATPPTATETTPLSPTQSNYVQAWLKATAPSR